MLEPGRSNLHGRGVVERSSEVDAGHGCAAGLTRWAYVDRHGRTLRHGPWNPAQWIGVLPEPSRESAPRVVFGRFGVEFVPDEHVGPVHPRVMVRLDHIGLARTDVGFRSVVMANV